MEATEATPGHAAWTWADQVSTYRFWGLFLLYVLTAIAVTGFFTVVQSLRFSLELPPVEVGNLMTARSVGFLAGGFYLVWAVGRRRPVNWLIVIAALQLVGALLLFFSGWAAHLVLRLGGSFLFGIGSSAVLVAVPVLLAGGRGGSAALAVPFGLIVVVSDYLRILWAPFGGTLLSEFGFRVVAGAFVVATLLALIAVLPVKSRLFEEPPPPRGRPIPPRCRGPVPQALLCGFVPFYYLYWMYRAHGEVASLAPSRVLLSPRGAVGMGLFPFLIPIMTVTLIEQLNAHALGKTAKRLRRPWAVFLWSLFCMPVGVGLVQSAINRSLPAAPPASQGN